MRVYLFNEMRTFNEGVWVCDVVGVHDCGCAWHTCYSVCTLNTQQYTTMHVADPTVCQT